MKIKKIVLILLLFICVTGCTKLKDYSYDDIVNTLSSKSNNANTYRRGYKYFVPKGIALKKAGPNYAILESKDTYYYLYFDLVSYNNGTPINYVKDTNCIYSIGINYDGKTGYVNIKNLENEQYLIEIVYNYAKIEVMIDSHYVNNALANSISILRSVVYDDKVIETLLKDDNLTYTEEKFNMFNKSNNSSILNYTEEVVDEEGSPVRDTDLVN